MALTVLIVDDSAVIRKMIIRSLRLSGCAVDCILEAANGAEALQVLDDQEVDLVLADLNMPVLSGEEMIHRARQNPKTATVPIIVVSTEGSETRRANLAALGTGFVRKPFSPEVLGAAVRETLGGRDG
ncbi:MAG: response regulator [Chloroflexi bacterium]|nr:response regulator [Chloroflexota bacterium]